MKTIKNEEKKLLKQTIKQGNKSTKFLVNSLMIVGSLGFLAVSLSSYYNRNIIEILDASKIIFFPQGLTMMIYGCLGLILSINQILISLSGMGEGLNEFNKEKKSFTILRKKSFFRNIELSYSLDDIVRDTNIKTKKINKLEKTINKI